MQILHCLIRWIIILTFWVITVGFSSVEAFQVTPTATPPPAVQNTSPSAPGRLQRSFEEHSIAWLLISSVVGGFIGASAKLIFENILPQRLQQRREVIAVKRKYATPILLAADDLRNRLKNMIKYINKIEQEGWLSHHDPPEYYHLSTLYIIGRFCGWLEILRRTVVYLDFTTTKETSQYGQFLKAIEAGLTDPSLLSHELRTGYPERSQDHWIYSFVLQSIGERLIFREGKDGDGEYRTLGFASFTKKFYECGSTEWKSDFDSVTRLFQDLTSGDVRFRRIVATHALLNAFIDYADPGHVRTRRHESYLNLLSEQEAKILNERIALIGPGSQR
jgi:hypothetical protein